MNFGTINGADAYGLEAPTLMMPDPMSGPYQSYVAPGMPGAMVLGSGTGPAISLVGIALLLVMWRVAIELGSD